MVSIVSSNSWQDCKKNWTIQFCTFMNLRNESNWMSYLVSSARTLSDFLPPLLELSASPIYSVRVMASKALVAMTPPSEYMNILIKLSTHLPSPRECCCHNRLHGQLLQIKAVLERALCTVRWDLKELFIHSSHTPSGFETPLCFHSQCPFIWPLWGVEQGGCLAVAGDWSSALPPSQSGLPRRGGLTEKILLWDLPVKAQWHTHARSPSTSTRASGVWRTHWRTHKLKIWEHISLLFIEYTVDRWETWGESWHAAKLPAWNRTVDVAFTLCVLKTLKTYFLSLHFTIGKYSISPQTFLSAVLS